MPRRIARWILPLLLLAPASRGDPEFDQLQAEYDAAMEKWYEQMSQLYGQHGETAEGQGEAAPAQPPEPPPHPAIERIPKFKAYAEAHAKTPDAMPALIWLATHAAMGTTNYIDGKPQIDPAVSWAMVRLTDDHAADAALKDHLSGLEGVWYYVSREAVVPFYERVLRDNKDAQVQTVAKYHLALTLYGDSFGMDPDPKQAEHTKRAYQLFKDVVAAKGESEIGPIAAAHIFEIEHLQVGMKAPPIEGTDADGKPVRLADFAGKVVVLDFWGFW